MKITPASLHADYVAAKRKYDRLPPRSQYRRGLETHMRKLKTQLIAIANQEADAARKVNRKAA